MPMDTYFILMFMAAISSCESKSRQTEQPCNGACTASDERYQRGVRYTYRYSSMVTSSLQSAAAHGSGLALDCLIDINVLSGCLLTMKLRNSQIKKVSPQKEHSVQRLKNVREVLERNPLLFSMREGRVVEVCPKEGEPTWALNVKRAILSVLQTSHAGERQETVEETDVYGTCWSSYERTGTLLLKQRNLRPCIQDRMAHFSVHSVPLSDSREEALEATLECSQRQGQQAVEEVNCTETVRVGPLWGHTGGARTQTVTTLTLLRTQVGAPERPDPIGAVCSTDLRLELEAGRLGQARGPEETLSTVRQLCATKADAQQQAALFVQLVFQLRALSQSQLQALWHHASFKCRDDGQPLLDALPGCGSEACVSLITDLVLSGELEQDRASSLTSSLAFISHPTPAMVSHISALLQSPEAVPGALLSLSALVNSLCLRAQAPCSRMPEVQQLMQNLRERLGADCHGIEEEPALRTQKLVVLKAVGNAGLAAASFTDVLGICAQNPSSPLELRLAAIQAFRRIPCSANREALMQLYSTSQEDVEVRIAAYLQLMRCPNPDLLHAVKATLRNEISSQVGAFVWSHLTQIQKTEDPLKQPLMELLPDDIISKEFEAESWKYSSYMDVTMDTGFGGANMEGALVFSPSSLLPRSIMANLTVHILGRAFNLLEINARAENMEPLLKAMFGHRAPHGSSRSDGETGAPVRKRRSGQAGGEEEAGMPADSKRGGCAARVSTPFRPTRARDTQSGDSRPLCGFSVMVFGNELASFTCEDIRAQARKLSLSLAGVAVRLLQGQEVELSRRAVLATEELLLPSLSGLPLRLGLNMSSYASLRLRGTADLKHWSHFSIAGHVKPRVHVGVWIHMGVEGPFGQTGVEWALGLRSSGSLDAEARLQQGQDLRLALNTPEDQLDIFHFSSRVYSVTGDGKDELAVSRDRTEKTICTPQDWSRAVGLQLCSQVSHPLSGWGVLPHPGPVLLSLRLLKVDRGLHQYLLEAAYSHLPQRDTWLPLEASLHLFLGTPKSTVPRDVALDLSFSSFNRKLVLKVVHPLKSIHIQGQIDQVRGRHSGKLEVLIDDLHHYYIKGLVDMQTLPSEDRLLSHLEAKLTTNSRPIILSANFTRAMGRKISVSAVLRNLFKETASFSVLTERRVEEGQRQHTTEAELHLPGLLKAQIIGMLQHRGPLWSSALRLTYGLPGDAQTQQQKCHMTQTLRSERDPRQVYHLRAKQELQCSHITSINHKIHVRHEADPLHIQSALDLSYGKHWDQINNKRRVLLSHTYKNQSRHALTSYLLEFSLQVPEKHMNYKTQLLHSRVHQRGAQTSTHLKVNYNQQLPLVAGLQWRESSRGRLHSWEGSFNMDTPWLYVYTAHKLSQPQRQTLLLSAEITTRKWLTVRGLTLQGLYRQGSREREGLLHLHTPTHTYLKVHGKGVMGKQGLKVSSSLNSIWTPSLQGELSLENGRHHKSLQLAASYGKQNISLYSALSSANKKLMKRLVVLKVVLMEPRSPAVELELEGAVEELTRERHLYQKQGRLYLRQPFRHLPQSLLLQETFSLDLRQARYVLESKAVLNGDQESVHTLTISYQPSRPSVCSALTHPYSSELIPQDSEVCVLLYRNQTQQEVQGTVHIDKNEKLKLLGRIQNMSETSQHRLTLQVNLTHQIQLQIPPSVNLEGRFASSHGDGEEFDYLAAGSVMINHREEGQFSVQLNGSSSALSLSSSLNHPFNFTPKAFQVHVQAELAGEGAVRSSVSVRTDEEDQLELTAELLNTLWNRTRGLGARVVLRQQLLPAAQDTELQLSANISTDRLSMVCAVMQKESGALQAWFEGAVGGATGDRAGLWLSINGALQNTLSSLRALPTALHLQGALTHIPTLTEGRLRVMLREAKYELELRHHPAVGHTPGSVDPEHRGMLGEEVGWRRTSLYARAEDQTVCVNVSSSLGSWRVGGLRALLSHTSPHHTLHTAGLARNGSVLVSWTCAGRGVMARVELQVESWGLRARLEAGRREESEGWTLLSSLQLHTQGPASVCTADYQMNCTVEATEDLLSGQCSGNTAGKGTEMVVRGKVVVLGCSSHLEVQVESDEVEWAGLDLEVSCSPQLGVRGLLRHALPLWGLPSHSNLEMYVTPPTAHLHLALGSCRLSASTTSNSTSATANLTNHCPALQGAGVPEFVEISGVWSLATCRSALSCRLSLDRENLALQLEQWCEPSAWISGTLTHSFSWLLHRGLPPHSSLTLQAPGGRTQTAILLLAAGPCRITANGDTGPEGRSQWLWAAESKCPLLQAHFNGSLRLNGCAVEAVLDSGAEGRLRGEACRPGFRVDGVFQPVPSPLGGPPDHHRLLLAAEASPQQLQGDLRLRLGDCAVRASAQMQSRDRLQGTVQLHNNCTALQDLGIPARMQGSGVLVINRKLLESHLFVHTDESDLQAKVRLKAARGQQEALVQLSHSVPLLHRGGVPANATLSFSSERKADSHQHRLSCSMDSQQLSEAMKVEQTMGELRVQCQLDHTLALLRAWGLPQTNSIQAKLASGEAHSLAFHSQLGAGTTSLKLKLRDTPKDTEAAGTLQHSSPWQQQLGLPKAVEAMCAVRGALPQLQARASLSVEGEQLLGTSLNISLPARQPARPEGHLSLLMSLTGSPLLKELKLPHRFNTNLSVHIKGPQQRACWDLRCDRGQSPVAGEEGEEGARGWELKAALQHIAGGPETPALQLDAWGKLTDSQLRGSLAVNRETNSSLAFTVQGHNLADRKEFKLRLLQSIRELRSYLPARLGVSAQLNHSSSRLGGEAELLLGGGEVRVQGVLAHTQSSFSQDLQLDHSFKQLKILPKNVEMRMKYEGRNQTHHLQQHLLWGGQDLRVLGLYTAPPGPDADTHRLQVQVSSAFAALPHECDLDVQLGGSARSRLDRMLVRWAGLSSYEQARALCSWSSGEEGWEGQLDLRQPFTPHLSHLHLHALSHRRASSLRYSSQAQFSWNDGKPVNVTLQMNRHRHTDTSRGQACLYLSPGQLETVLPLVDIQGCGSMAQEKNSYSQKAELNWGHKRMSQAMSYQRGPRGMHSVQLEGGAENVSASPCPSLSFLARVKTNCRSQLEHHLLLSVCPPQPSWAVSGHHRINTGQELLYSQTRLSVSGHPQHCSFTLALTNASSPQRSNISLHTTFEVGDGGVDLGVSVSSSRKGFGLLMQAKLDGSERVWLQGALKSHCLQTAAGYNDDDDITIALCLEGRGHLIFAAQRRGGGYKRHRLALLSVSPANQSLTLTAQGCVEHLWRTEARVRELGSHVRNKILARIHTLQRLLLEFSCQELSEGPLRLAQRAEVLLIQGLRGVWLGWRSGPLRYALTHTLPLHLHLLHHITQQLQQELKRPLNTLAGVYQDVTGRWLHLDWHHTTTSWAGNLVESLPEVLEDHHLRAPFKTVLGIFTNILDVVSQQTAQWVEAKAAVALTGLRRRLALLFRLSQSRCEVAVQVPLPRRPWSEVGGAGLTEFLLEDWLLKPILALSSLSPTAELYQLKRKLMDSPFRYQALFVSDQFVVSFDGHLYEIPEKCGLILAHDVVQESFTLLLNPVTTPQRTLVVQMGNITVGLMSEGQVEVNCHLTDAQISQNGVTVRRESHLIEVSNQDGTQVVCDQSQALCSLTLDGWQHGVSAGLLGTNDNEAGNEWTQPDGSQANSLDHFIHSWQVHPQCGSDSGTAGLCSNGSRAGQTADESSCALLFSSPESPLQPCFRVVDPGQFLSVCKRSCAAVPHSAPCRLAAAFVHMCRRNYVPLEVPQQCVNG